MPPERVVEHLTHVLTAESIPFEEDALWLLGRAADGSMRDAMSLTDQAIAFGEGKVLATDVRSMLGTLDHGQVYGVLHALLEGDARGVLEAVRHLAEQGPDWSGVLSEVLNVLHRVAVAQALPEAVDNGQGDRDRVLALAQALPAEDVQFYYQMGLIGRRDLPLAPDPRGGFEMVLLRMLAFRPADADGAPRSPLKDLGISKATADSLPTPVAGAVPAAAPAVVIAPPPAEPTVAPAPVPVVTPEPAPARVAPVDVVATAAAPVVQAEVSVPSVAEAAAPVVDVPWATSAASEPATVEGIAAESVSETPVVVEQAAEPAVPATVQPEPVAATLAPQPVAAVPVVAQVAESEEGDDDEPPPGDYDYAEADADSLDYNFDVSAAESVPEPDPLPAAMPATGLAAEWLELFPRLGVSGMTGSIGANCTLIEANGDNWLLHLDPGHSALFNSTQQRRLNDALNQHLARTINLRIELNLPQQETPAQAAARKRAERQREAEQSIHDDPLVQKMIQQFAAVIRADSIEPVNS